MASASRVSRTLRGTSLSILIIAFGTGPQELSAQTPDMAFEQVISSRTLAVVQDQEGFMWIATASGLLRYDGYHTVEAEYGDCNSQRDDAPVRLHVDRSGTLWIGTDDCGLLRYDRSRDTFVRMDIEFVVPDGPDDAPTIFALASDRSGRLWIGARDGLYLYDPDAGTVETFQHDPQDSTSVTDGPVWAIHEDREGTIWVGTGGPYLLHPINGGLSRFNAATRTFTRFLHNENDPNSLIHHAVRALYEDSRGNFWVGTWGDGLHRMDRQTGTFERHTYDPRQPNKLSRPHLRAGSPVESGVTFIHEDREGRLWIGALQGGVNIYDQVTGRMVHLEADAEDPLALTGNRVVAIAESRDGTIWIGTMSGLFRRITQQVRIPNVQLPGDDGNVFAVAQSRSGHLWIGTSVGGLYRYNRRAEQFTNYRHDPEDRSSLAPGRVTDVYLDRRDVLWAATPTAICRLYPETGTFARYKHGAPGVPEAREQVLELYDDSRGRLWFYTFEKGIRMLDRETGEIARYLEDLYVPEGRPGHIRDLYEDRARRLWVGTTHGFHLFEPGRGVVKSYFHDPGDPGSISHDMILAIDEDSKGRLWVMTRGGLDRFDPRDGTFTHFPEAHGSFPAWSVTSIVSDARDRVWMVSTAHPAVRRFDPKTGMVRMYGERASNYVRLDMKNYFTKGAGGELLLGRVNSFYTFFPEELERQINEHPPQLALAMGVRTDEENRGVDTEFGSGTDSVVLDHFQNSFAFRFAALHYADPPQNRYLFKLEGHDDEWLGPRTQRTADYHKIPPGAYVFRVKAANSDGVWTEEGASMAVVVLPPWWRTWWAYTLYGLLFLAVMLAAAGVQRRYVQRREQERVRAREQEHAREIQAMNEQLREHEQHLQSQNERLLELDAQKSRFFANISHEFRTPLTLILGPLEDLLQGHYGRLESPVRRPMLLMQRSGRRLLRLISQLLELSNVEAGKMQPNLRRLDLADVLRQIVLAFSARAETSGIALSFSADTAPLPFVFDPDMLETVTANLLSNAFKFTGSGGKIRVSLTRGDDIAEIAVRDTGRGIPQEELPFIFDRFYQVDGSAVREHEGTGIGLALAKELVELHGGTIEVESEVGFGTSFTVRLPVLEPTDDIRDEPLESAGRLSATVEEERRQLLEIRPIDGTIAASAESPTARDDAPLILIVEDNPDMRAYLRGHLCTRYRLLEAGDGDTGLDLARQHHPALVLSDVMMPRIDGYTLCDRIKSDDRLMHIPVVLLTAKGDAASKMEGLQAGADDYLGKPFDAEELLARMENLIELRRRLHERYSGEVRLGPSEVVVSSEEAAFVREVRDVIEKKMADSGFTVGDLADVVGLSTRQLQRRLRDAVDLSAAAYIRMMRLERAAQLLKQDVGLVSEVAYAVGFKNANHFSTLFRQVFGVPPSEYSIDSRDDVSS